MREKGIGRHVLLERLRDRGLHIPLLGRGVHAQVAGSPLRSDGNVPSRLDLRSHLQVTTRHSDFRLHHLGQRTGPSAHVRLPSIVLRSGLNTVDGKSSEVKLAYCRAIQRDIESGHTRSEGGCAILHECECGAGA